MCARARACVRVCVRVCVARRPSLQGFMCRVHKSPQAGVPERGTLTGRARTTKRPATAARPHPHPACPDRPPRLPTRPRPRDRCVQVGRASRRSAERRCRALRQAPVATRWEPRRAMLSGAVNRVRPGWRPAPRRAKRHWQREAVRHRGAAELGDDSPCMRCPFDSSCS